MKKYISIFISAVIFLSLIPDAASLSAPYWTPVSSAADFAAMEPNGNYRLESDITLDVPYDKEFTGSFDGNGKTVTISAPMFIKVSDAAVFNFIVNGNIKLLQPAYTVGTDDFAAAVAVEANGASEFKNITSNVDFRSTSPNTRIGAIVATSEAGHAITIDGCINNGNIYAIKYAGGIYGWSPEIGNSTVRNCINNGNITASGYCGGIIARLGSTSGSMTVENCINNGTITSTGSFCGGIYAYSNTVTSVVRCINNGNIKAGSGDTGGIGGCVAQTTTAGISDFRYNINTGNVTNRASGKTGGILGYQYGTSESFAVMIGNVNLGKISARDYVSQIIAYTNSTQTVIAHNVGAGKVSGTSSNKTLIVGLSSANINAYTVTGNYYIENDGTKTYSYADDDKNASNRIALDNRPEGSVIFVSAEELASPKIAEELNYVLANEVFEVRNGKTLIRCRHEYPASERYDSVLPTCTESGITAGCKCAGCDAVIGCEEWLSEGHSYENGICLSCGETDPSVTQILTPETSDTELESDSENSSLPAIMLSVISISLITIAVTARKKKNH